MAVVSSKPSENSINQQELLSLHNHESDMFLEIFSEEICKLTRVLADKKRQQQAQTKEIQFNFQRGPHTSSHLSGLVIKKGGSSALSHGSKYSPKIAIDLRPEVKVEPTHLTFAEFCQVDFGYRGLDRPLIVNDLLTYLTGTKYCNYVPKITDQEEKKNPSMPSGVGDEELTNLRDSIKENVIYRNLVSAFKVLWGFNRPQNQVQGSDIDGVAVLLE